MLPNSSSLSMTDGALIDSLLVPNPAMKALKTCICSILS